jgi:hypothetical protein
LQTGTHLEVQYALMTFGLPRGNFPVSAEDGSIDLVMFQSTAREFFEELDPVLDTVVNSKTVGSTTLCSSELDNQDERCLPECFVPGPNDVIMGRSARNAPGNVQLKRMLEEYREQYDRATHRMEKMAVTHHVFTSIKELGGRFVSQRKGGKRWEEAPDETAREKIALGFRNLRRGAGPAVDNSCGRSAKRRALG